MTIGVYGQWGAGKTSFVELVKRELGTNVRFIPFIAWPYKTSDELWRALILTIARDLYGVKPDVILDRSVDDRKPESFGERVRTALTKDALVLHDSSDTTALSDFKDLVAELDRIELGTIRKSSASAIDDPEALQATVNTVTAAVSAVSPLGTALRALVGLGDGLKSGPKPDTSRNTLGRMQSIEKFRDLLCRLFAQRAEGKRVCVFIDDLDRAMPDVALDLLEAIRIFLGEANCTFIVAADQELIGQGLKARFRDLMESAPSASDQDFYARKGREYFEKIIQFGVPVPEPTPVEGYKFIAASFPGWSAAADLVTTAVGANPRRLRQYCTLLDYRHGVWKLLRARQRSVQGKVAPQPDAADEKARFEAAREKAVALYWRDPELVLGLLKLARRADGHDRLRDLERALAPPASDVADSKPGSPVSDAGLADVVRRARGLLPLRELLVERPLLSEQPGSDLEAILAGSDLQPDGTSVLTTDDPALSRILEMLLQKTFTGPEMLLREDVKRLLELNRNEPKILEALIELAKTDRYYSELKIVDQILREPPEGEVPPLLPPALALFKHATDDKVDDAKELERRRDVIQRKPPLFALSPTLVGKFAEMRAGLPPASELLPNELRENPSPATQDDALASYILKAVPDDMTAALRKRLAVAEQAIERRRFAKVDAMGHSWPELRTYLNYDRPTLLAIEGFALNGKPLAGSLARFAADERLVRFMKLRPYLGEIYPEVAKAIAATAAAVATPQMAVPPPTPPGPLPAPIAGPQAPSIPPAPGTAPVSMPPSAPPLARFVPPVETGTPPSEAPADRAPEIVKTRPYENLYLEFRLGNLDPFDSSIRCDLEVFDRNRTSLVSSRFSVQSDSAIELQDDTQMPELQVLLEHQLQQLHADGSPLEAIRSVIKTRLDQTRTCRALLRLPSSGADKFTVAFNTLAWESLYVPEVLSTPALDGTLSVVRQVQLRNLVASPVKVEKAVRLLAVFPSTSDAPVSSIQETAELLKNLVEPRGVRMRMLTGSTATLPKIREALRQFRPHIFYYLGHGANNQILVADDENNARWVDPPAMQVLFKGCRVSLAILLSDSTGAGLTSVENGLAGRLAATEIPVVIGTRGNVLQQSAVLFTISFFQSLLNGDDVEFSMTEARRSLALNQNDWSRYVLFSGLERLEELKFTPNQ